MILARTIAECRDHRARFEGRVALVPTMGALHAGHVSLLEAAKKRAAHVVASIFVNPTQFGPREDFNKYPRPIEDDLRKCDEAGAALVFNPPVEEMYRPGLPAIEIDLDLLLYGNEIIDAPGLSVPHPLMHERLFVLKPLAEIAPQVLHPIHKKPIAELLENVLRAG